MKPSSKEEIVKQSLKLLNILMSDSVSRQFYTKEIQMLFKLIEYESIPPVIVKSPNK